MDTKNSREYLVKIGERLKGVRLLMGLTQKQVAAATGMSQSFLSSMERGQKTACTAQIITLIHFYKAPYSLIFGDEGDDLSVTGFPEPPESNIYMDLLNMLVGKADSAALLSGTTNCLKLVVYIIFRAVYQANPKNSDKLFSIEYSRALGLVMDILSRSPANISRYIKFSRSINASKFELPPERNSELRSFIRECEQMLDMASSDLKIINTK